MTDVKYFRPRNWPKWQDYRRARPAYIRNYTALLDDPDYSRLSPECKGTLHGLWLLCAGTGGALPWDCRWIAGKLGENWQGIARKLPILQASNFIELCDKGWKAHGSGRRKKTAPETETETETEKIPPCSPPKGDGKVPSHSEAFLEFWEAYPRQRRGNKQGAWQAWKRAIERASEGEIVSGLRAYVESDEVARGFAKGAAAWLNDDRWTVDYSRKAEAASGAGGNGSGNPSLVAVGRKLLAECQESGEGGPFPDFSAAGGSAAPNGGGVYQGSGGRDGPRQPAVIDGRAVEAEGDDEAPGRGQ